VKSLTFILISLADTKFEFICNLRENKEKLQSFNHKYTWQVFSAVVIIE